VSPVGIDEEAMMLLRHELDTSVPDVVGMRGTAYVFARIAADAEWTEQAQIATEWFEFEFGTGLLWSSAAMSSDTLVMVNPRGDGAQEFVRTGEAWTRQTDLERPDRENWGYSVAMSGDNLLVGAPVFGNVGSVWAYRRVGAPD
jgi:hypothetical protein